MRLSNGKARKEAGSVAAKRPASLTGDETETQAHSDWIAEIPKYAALLGFCFYLFGFIIWSAHFSKYGCAVPTFWKTEFFSASMCYLAITFSIAFPSALVWMKFQDLRRPNSTNPMVVLFRLTGREFSFAILLTAALLLRVSVTFFPSSPTAKPTFTPLIAIGGVALIHLFVACLLRKYVPASRIASLFSNEIWFGVYLMAVSMVSLHSSDRLDRGFLIHTVGLVIALITVNGIEVEAHWSSWPVHLKILALLCAGFVLVDHARTFGKGQFSLIPQSVGGGEPLQAMLLLSGDEGGIQTLLPLPRPEVTKLASTASPKTTNNLSSLSSTNSAAVSQPTNRSVITYGPASILMRSEHEILFYVPADASQTNVPIEARSISSTQVQGIRFLNRP